MTDPATHTDRTRYVALLRGINVGGTNKVAMPALRDLFENAGMSDVRTYINSGNVIFSAPPTDRAALVTSLEDAIRSHTGVAADVQLRDEDEMRTLIEALPPEWRNDASMKCDVVFVQPDVDIAETLASLAPRPGIEDVVDVPGAIIWRVDRADATRSRLTRIAGTPLYRRVTVRNCNTARKLYELLADPAAGNT